ncbi:adenosylcobinamide amidohydrolase [Kitasatospora sp. NPDC096147]|uniref:adenosylcobinamide amidohydrolase n=1 Tax=Kitasatospora sp. NPDC096147 TaxID=3364093 RepID=UPI00382E5E94
MTETDRVPRAAAAVDGSAPVLVDRSARAEDGACRHHLLWRAGPGWRMVSSAVLGGGIGERQWVLNAQVRSGYDRLDPDRHLAELAAAEGLTGPGVGLMTAAEVDRATRSEDGGVTALVTTGLGVPTWAAAPEPTDPPGADRTVPTAYVPGTVNIVAVVPVAVSDAGLVNLLATATEAKVQALLEAGYACTGTPSDAVCVAVRTPVPGRATEPFGGPRSPWGARLARAVHRAVLDGARADTLARRTGPPAPHPAPRSECFLP